MERRLVMLVQDVMLYLGFFFMGCIYLGIAFVVAGEWFVQLLFGRKPEIIYSSETWKKIDPQTGAVRNISVKVTKILYFNRWGKIIAVDVNKEEMQ